MWPWQRVVEPILVAKGEGEDQMVEGEHRAIEMVTRNKMTHPALECLVEKLP
jgi:hypothetical protein